MSFTTYNPFPEVNRAVVTNADVLCFKLDQDPRCSIQAYCEGFAPMTATCGDVAFPELQWPNAVPDRHVPRC